MGRRGALSTHRWVLAAALVGSGMVFLDSTVVTVAMPRIGRELPTLFLGVFEGQSYVYTGYLLTLSALLILAGAANDHYGRKRMFRLGVAGFGLTSVLCGLAPNMEALVVFRVLQGVAGALLVPSSLSLITAFFEGEARGRAFGYWSAGSAATTILGPVIGGVLVDWVSWRAVFLLNVPFALVALYASGLIDESRDAESSGVFDWGGSLLTALAVGGLSFGGIYGQQREWRDPLAYVSLAVGVLACVAFVPWMARAKHPLVPLGLFRSRNFAVTNLSTLLIYGALYVVLYYLTLFMQGVLGYTARAAGVAGMPATLLLVLFSSRAGALSARSGPRAFMVGGPLLMAVGILTLTLVPVDTAPWLLDKDQILPPIDYFTRLLPGLLLFGAGLTLMVTPLVTALMSSVPVRNSGLASAINNAISRVGPQLVGAVLFVAMTSVFYSGLERRVPDADLDRPAPWTSPAPLRQAYSPLNPPKRPPDGQSIPGPVADQLARLENASREASTDAFHLAMLVAAGLLAAGALVNLAIENGPRRGPETPTAAG